MDRTYRSAITFLKGRQRMRRPDTRLPASQLPPAQLPNASPTFRGTPSIEGMRGWLQKLGHSDDKIDSLNIIHVAGTKGKGSTSAFVESFLRVHGERTGFPRKTGLYTSPHLIHTNERIRVDFRPLDRDVFAQNVFEVRDRLSLQQPGAPGPRYLQLLALVSYHTFLKEQVDVAIYETHHGGQYDATNTVQHPVATAVTSIGMDHLRELGPSIENVAWHKAGIFKPGAPAFSHPQEPRVAKVLADRAAEKGVALEFVQVDRDLPGIDVETQLSNASLAREVANAFLGRRGPGPSPRLTSQDVADGIRRFRWPGRFQIVPEGRHTWCLDGAHNELSVGEAAAWFQKVSSQSSRPPMRTLIFAHKSDQRDGPQVLERLLDTLGVPIQHAIFTAYSDDVSGIDDELERYSQCWRERFPQSQAWTEPTPLQAMARARELGAGAEAIHILATGSLHLVGSILGHLGDP